MKRLILALCVWLLLGVFTFAQETGFATQEMRSGGMVAAHASLPLNSKIKIKNNDTGKEAEATISARISTSATRIIDLSYDVWEALGMTEYTMVTLTYNEAAFTPVGTGSFDSDWDAVAMPEEADGRGDDSLTGFFEEEDEFPVLAEAPIEPPPSSSVQTVWVNPAQVLYHLLILDRRYCIGADIGLVNGISVLYKYRDGADGYLITLYTSPSAGAVFPVLPDRSRILVDMVSARKDTLKDYVDSNAFRRFVSNPTILSQLQRSLEGTMIDIKIISGLPDPNSGKIYRIQVGAFSVPETAARSMQQIRNAGFDAAQEMFGSFYRVLAVGVRAEDVSAAVQALGAAGFKEVWIKE